MPTLVRDVMTGNPDVASPYATLQETAKKMKSLDVGALPVCGTDGRLAGMITDRDVTVRAVAEGRDPATTHVRDVMTPDAFYVFDDQKVKEAARVMEQRQVRRVPVLDRSWNLVGILSLADIALSDADDDVTADTLEGVSSPR